MTILSSSGQIESVIYNQFAPRNRLNKSLIPVMEYYPVITPEDIDSGSIKRYFVRQSNHKNGEISEINVQTYNKVRTNPLYIAIELDWKIVGKLDDVMGTPEVNSPVRISTGVITANRLTVEEMEKEMPGLSYKLMNFSQFWVDNGIA